MVLRFYVASIGHLTCRSVKRLLILRCYSSPSSSRSLSAPRYPYDSAFADLANGVQWVQCDKVSRNFHNTLRRYSGALGGSFPDVSGG
jgi:hypothetical protein